MADGVENIHYSLSSRQDRQKGSDEHKVNVSAETAYVPFGFAIQVMQVVDMHGSC